MTMMRRVTNRSLRAESWGMVKTSIRDIGEHGLGVVFSKSVMDGREYRTQALFETVYK